MTTTTTTEAIDARSRAGLQLGLRLLRSPVRRAVVTGVAHGGVPVAVAVARVLRAPLDVVAVRKLRLPFDPSVVMGAVGEGDVVLVDAPLIARLGVRSAEVTAAERRERAAIAAFTSRLREAVPRLDLTGRTAVVVDDGIASGATVSAACVSARRLGADRVVVAAPIASSTAVRRLRGADAVVVLTTASSAQCVDDAFRASGPVDDADVVRLLTEALS